MQKNKNIKKMLAMLSLSVLVVSSSALVVVSCVSCKADNSENIPEIKDYNKLIVQEINNITYSKIVKRNSKVEELVKLISADFIKRELDKEISKYFKNDFFILNKFINETNEKLVDDDLKKTGIINVKVNYDYAEYKNQTTNLKLTVQENRILLADAFKDFKFFDDKSIVDFLDANNLQEITNNIVKFLGETLEVAGLELLAIDNKTWTRNSIILKAKEESQKYLGEVKLSWPYIKLLELWTYINPDDDIHDEFLKQGLIGYFYLDIASNEVRYINIFHLKSGKNRIINKGLDGFHIISFHHEPEDNSWVILNITSDSMTDSIMINFDYNNGLQITVDSSDSVTGQVKIFYNNNWVPINLKKGPKIFDELARLV